MEMTCKFSSNECVDIFYDYFKNREDNEINYELKNLSKDELSDLILNNIKGENTEKALMCGIYVTDKKGTKFNNEIIELSNKYLTVYPQGDNITTVLKILADAYLSEYEIEKALKVCETLNENEYIHSIYCKCLYRADGLEEAVIYLEERLVYLKEKYGQEPNEIQQKLINSIISNLELYKKYKNKGTVYIPTTPKGREKLGINLATTKRKISKDDKSLSSTNLEYTLASSADTDTFVAFDFEATGLNIKWDEITEIGAVKIEKGKVVDKFSILVNPSRSISKEVSEKTGITNEMVATTPKISSVLPKFIEFSDGYDLVGHNVVKFDIKFLDKYLSRINKSISCELYDTLKLSKMYFKGMKSYKLTELSKTLNIEHTNAHRALSDAETTAELYIKCFNASK